MPELNLQPARTLLCVAPVLLLLACTPPPRAEPPTSGSYPAALHALRTGNLPALRNELGKGENLSDHALELRDRLDPEAWLVALGASTRQFNLQAAYDAMQQGDIAALRDAIGFTDQALHGDILRATHSVGMQRAADHNYYVRETPAIAVLDAWQAPRLPADSLALHLTADWRDGARVVRIHFGRDAQGITDLRAAVHQAGASRTGAQPDLRAADPAKLLPADLNAEFLQDERVTDVSLRVLRADGRLERMRLLRGEDGWARFDHERTTLQQRLESMRDARLRRIRNAAHDHVLRHGRWPGNTVPLMLQPGDYSDPTSEAGALGWAQFSAQPQAGIEFRQATEPQDIAAIALSPTPQGQRAITREGELVWATR
jgi:hypothetical protein